MHIYIISVFLFSSSSSSLSFSFWQQHLQYYKATETTIKHSFYIGDMKFIYSRKHKHVRTGGHQHKNNRYTLGCQGKIGGKGSGGRGI